MKSFVQKGCTITLTAPYAVSAGGGLLVGSIFGIASDDAANGADVETCVDGVFDIAKAAGAITQGALVYWDNTAKAVTTTASGNKLIGVAVSAAASGDATARVRLNGAFIA